MISRDDPMRGLGEERSTPPLAVAAGIVFFLAVIPLLIYLPRMIPPPPGVASAAARVGYNTSVAYKASVLWIILGVTASLLLARRGWLPRRPPDAGDGTERATLGLSPSRCWIERISVFSLVFVAYCPIFLARRGPFLEDVYFLNLLYRMDAGQMPYVDFEFLYGPLMIYPAFGWMKLFGGFSMASYYHYLAWVNALTFALLVAALQRFLPRATYRYAVFFVLAPLFCDTLLGLNYLGIRRVLPVVIIWLIGANTIRTIPIVVAGILAGLQLAYSLEYGVSVLAAAIGLYGVLFALGERRGTIRSAATLVAVATGTWTVTCVLLLGSQIPLFVRRTIDVLQTVSTGVAGFEFYWTLASIALFGFLALTAIVVGRGLGAPGRPTTNATDRVLLAGLIYAAVLLKSGLNRSDIWHLTPAALVIVVAVLVLPPANAFSCGRFLRRLSVLLCMTIAGTYALGNAREIRFVASGYVQGMRDVLSGRPTGKDSVVSRRPALIAEQTEPKHSLVRLAAYLADPVRNKRPVFFYGDRIPIAVHLGVLRLDYLSDDFMYLDPLHPSSIFLEKHPDVLIVVSRMAYERLFGPADAKRFPEFWLDSRLDRIIGWLASVHAAGVMHELRVKDELWRERVGDSIRPYYHSVAEFGDNLVLARRNRS